MTCNELAQRLAATAHQPARGIHAQAEGPTVRFVNNNYGTDRTWLIVERSGRFYGISNTGGGSFDLGPVPN